MGRNFKTEMFPTCVKWEKAFTQATTSKELQSKGSPLPSTDYCQEGRFGPWVFICQNIKWYTSVFE